MQVDQGLRSCNQLSDVTADVYTSEELDGGALPIGSSLSTAVVGQDSMAKVGPVSSADDTRHLVLGLAMVTLGLELTRRSADTAGADRPS